MPHATKERGTTWLSSLDGSAPVAVELCSGIGAIGLGLRSLGFQIAHAYDSWNEGVAIYNHNAPELVAVECDLLTHEGLRRVKEDCRKLGGVDLLAAGPPCKGFSQIRNGHHHKAKANQHNRLLTVMPDYVAALSPRLVLIENVPGLIRHSRGKTLKTLLARLEAPGPRGLRYRVQHDVFDAAVYGTPQARKRASHLLCSVGNSTTSVSRAPVRTWLHSMQPSAMEDRFPRRWRIFNPAWLIHTT